MLRTLATSCVFEGLHNGALFENDSDLAIKVSFDKEARTVTIADNGIGLNREDAINHLGTIAKSGTREFFTKLTGDQQKDASLIGQFGVGFYSAFIVADKVSVYSRKAGENAQPGHTLGMRYGCRRHRRVQH